MIASFIGIKQPSGNSGRLFFYMPSRLFFYDTENVIA
jgi:hypothetical protein